MLQQSVIPVREVFYAGESITIEISAVPDIPGKAVFRTNIPGVRQHRRELIECHEKQKKLQDLDWYDIEIPGNSSCRRITLPLIEIGCFEGKCCFIPQKGSKVFWAEGGNFRFKVTNASSIAGNTIYSAFVRQFGVNLNRSDSLPLPSEIKRLDNDSFSVIPPSGTFRDLKKHLDHIFEELNCNILQLLPIHPIPSSFGRMGRYGSPFAALDYFAVEPSLAEFDPAATPMEQFGELVDAVHARHGKIFLDIPVNHTGWASKLQQEHPEYFCRNENGRFENPGAWGIVWADLCKLDYSVSQVASLMADVFLFWCRKGVDGFRCDAGYMVPESAWDYIVAKVRSYFPETTFLLEGLGGPMDIQERLLRNSGLDCGYSEMFQNYSRSGMEYCLQLMKKSAFHSGNLISFAETHDNNRLAENGHLFARFRFMACALLSTGGAFGFANGAEFFASEKIDVHGNSALNFGAEENLCRLAGGLNRLLAFHPAFAGNSKLENITCGQGEAMAVLRSSENGDSRVLVLLNPDCKNVSQVSFISDGVGEGYDLLSGEKKSFSRIGENYFLDLAPGEGLVIEVDKSIPEDIAAVQEVLLMEKRAFIALHKWQDEKLPSTSFIDSPEKFVAELSGSLISPLTVWNGEQDTRRIIPVPYGDLLLIRNPFPFRCIVREQNSGFIRGVKLKDGTWGALLVLENNPLPDRRNLNLTIESFEEKQCRRLHSVLCQLPEYRKIDFRKEYSAREVREREILAFGSNDSGSYAMFPAGFGSFPCKYHALLAVNNDQDVPVDRYCLFTGLHIYLVTDGYSTPVDINTMSMFSAGGENNCRWCFRVPAGQGRYMDLKLEFRFAISGDAVELKFYRPENSGVPGSASVAVILRPEIEDRINHHVTRASIGPEWEFPKAVKNFSHGFSFVPGARELHVETTSGSWHSEPEWHYMCDLPAERYYGLEDKTDRYSPGYFYVPLQENSSFALSAWVNSLSQCRWSDPNGKSAFSLQDAMRRFIVKRGQLNTVIAGFPWFLDWGRDTLIALRGLVKVPEFQNSCAMILRAFAGFEKSGTLPNVMHGSHDANRDTSDAPLYLIIGVRDYVAETGDKKILDSDCGGRKLKDIIGSIISSYISGTPNGIKMDPASGLIFSPAHFTWMDTNFPAGTPREGYPAEIQALWYAALEFTGNMELALLVQSSIEKYFFPEYADGCSDCLHCLRETPAALAEADDHIRSNALLLITMGAIKDPDLQLKIINSSSRLLIPGAIRTLADQKVRYKLPVKYNGKLINDPEHPYCGTYSGPENESRKKAYHNGTAWCWPFPAYCEALVCCGGVSQKKRALSLLYSSAEYLEKAVPGELSEVADGNAPHTPGGCPAQAWSITELFRVAEMLQKL